MIRKLIWTLAVALGIGLSAATVEAQIRPAPSTNGTFISISCGGGKGTSTQVIQGGPTCSWTSTPTITSTSTTSSNPSASIYTGSTNPSNYYANFLQNSNLTLANALVYATGSLFYYNFAPSDSDAAGFVRTPTFSYLETGGTQNLGSSLYGTKARAMHRGTGTAYELIGGDFSAFDGHAGEQASNGGTLNVRLAGVVSGAFAQSSAATVPEASGVVAVVENDYATVVTNSYGINATVGGFNATPMTTAYGGYFNMNGTVTPTTGYGLYTDTVKGSTKWSIYAADSTAPSRFVGGVGVGTGTPTSVIPIYLQGSAAHLQVQYENTSTAAGAYMDYLVKSGTTTAYVGASNQNFGAGPLGSSRAWLDTTAGVAGAGWDYSAPNATGNHRFYTGGYNTTNERVKIDSTGLTLSNNAAIVMPAGTGMAVANVGANSCGTSAASIAGGNNVFVITTGATGATQCRVAFTFAATTEWDCVANDQNTTVAVRTTPVDTTHTDFIGTFTAADKITGICFPR